MNICPGAASNTTCPSAEAVTSFVKLFAATQCCLVDNNFTPDEIKDKSYFHFIIVGAGSAGSVVANRLSEVEGWNVLLLEAGTKPPYVGFVPQLYGQTFNTKYDWNYTTINNHKTSQAVKIEKVPWPRGKVLGGSSMLNAMFYVKGRSEDYRTWFNEGNPSWSPENVYKYEKKAESLQNQELKKDPRVNEDYGDNGPQVVNNFNNTYRKLTEKVMESWSEIGFKQVKDVNSARYKSPGLCGIITVSAANGIRYDTYRSYLLPARERKNLKIVTDAFVTKILIDENKKAYGVEVDINGKTLQLFAKNEVILSAGAINSPQLLMLSGIGPKRHLKSKKIECKVNLPAVGRNLQDHLNVLVPIFGNISNLENRKERDCSLEKYCCNRTGYLAQGAIEDVLAFYSWNQNLKYPEYQNHLVIVSGNTEKIQGVLLGFKKSISDSIAEYLKTKTLYLFTFHLLHPYSRGSVTLNTSNPYDKPIIDANYFGDYRDLKSTARGITMLSNIVNTKFFKSIDGFVQRLKWPECDNLEFNTTSYWMCQAKNIVLTLYHPVGTCKMGPNPMNSVVDNYLKVHGVRDLRVIDASIMPKITSGNTNAPTIMIGEMGADMIKKDTFKKDKFKNDWKIENLDIII